MAPAFGAAGTRSTGRTPRGWRAPAARHVHDPSSVRLVSSISILRDMPAVTLPRHRAGPYQEAVTGPRRPSPPVVWRPSVRNPIAQRGGAAGGVAPSEHVAATGGRWASPDGDRARRRSSVSRRWADRSDPRPGPRPGGRPGAPRRRRSRAGRGPRPESTVATRVGAGVGRAGAPSVEQGGGGSIRASASSRARPSRRHPSCTRGVEPSDWSTTSRKRWTRSRGSPGPGGPGTGIIVSAHGRVITNNHVIAQAVVEGRIPGAECPSTEALPTTRRHRSGRRRGPGADHRGRLVWASVTFGTPTTRPGDDVGPSATASVSPHDPDGRR